MKSVTQITKEIEQLYAKAHIQILQLLDERREIVERGLKRHDVDEIERVRKAIGGFSV